MDSSHIDFTTFFRTGKTYNDLACVRPDSFNVTIRTNIFASTFLTLALVNFTLHSLLIAIILYNWKAVFKNDFIYKLILTMACIAVLNMLVHFIMTIPCTFNGCLYFSNTWMEFFTCAWETLEFGFFWAVFFISIDRFFTFYLQMFGKHYRKAWSIMLLLILCFCAQLIRFFMGCPKMYFVEIFDTLPCLDCYIFGISWHESSRGLVYNIPYVMFVIYLLIIGKILAMRYKVYTSEARVRKSDKMLAFQFFALCLIQLLCGFLQYFLNEDETNYVGLITISLPMDVQIANAVVLLTSNQVIRKGAYTLLCRKVPKPKMFATQIGAMSDRNNTKLGNARRLVQDTAQETEQERRYRQSLASAKSSVPNM